jgi:hypothetical protein
MGLTMKASGGDWGFLLVAIILATLPLWSIFVLIITLCRYRQTAYCGTIL